MDKPQKRSEAYVPLEATPLMSDAMNQGERRLFADSRRPERSSKVCLCLVAVFWIALDSGFARAQAAAEPSAEPFQIPVTTEEIKVDAVLDEAAWSLAARVPLPFETRPGENTPAPVETECLIIYDVSYVYVAFRAFDPDPDTIRAHVSDRDTAWNDDFVGVVLDTFNDERRAFEFFVNPLGVQMDLFIDDVSGNETASWDAIWNSAGRITDQGYVVEFAIPFQQLRFQSGGQMQTWGFDAVRFYPRSDRVRIASQPSDRNVSCYLCQISKVSGFEGATPGRNIELVPTLTSGRVDEREDLPEGELEEGSVDTEVGLTAKWGMTPSLTLSAALNPDFSQVEADVAQLDINTRFTLFFPERRPFFLEGADVFKTPFNTVFTRNVSDPDWGLKLTGKQGKNGIGVFAAQDTVTNLLFPGSTESDSESFDFDSDVAVLRYRLDFGESSSVGVLYTGRDGEDYNNQVAGVDGLYRFRESDSIRFQALGSRSRYPDEIAEDFDQPQGDFDDQAYRIGYVHESRNWGGWARYESVGEGFRADMGFMPRVDFEQGVTGVEHIWWGEEGAWFNRLSVGGEWERSDEQSGQLLDEETDVWVFYAGPKQSNLWFDLAKKDEYFDGIVFDRNFVRTWMAIRPVGDFRFEMFARLGDQIDFDNTRPADEIFLEPSLQLNLGLHLRTDLAHTYQRLDVDEGRLFTANLSQLRVIYQFNLRTFVRAIVQYTDIERNTALYIDEETEAKTEGLFSQLLFSYKINPRTVVFFGYSDSREADGTFSLTQENRGVFLKLGYSWVL